MAVKKYEVFVRNCKSPAFTGTEIEVLKWFNGNEGLDISNIRDREGNEWMIDYKNELVRA